MSAVERLIQLVKRELAAADVSVVAEDAVGPDDPNALRRTLPGQRVLVARFSEPPADPEVRLRRLDMLIESFRALLEGSSESRAPSRTPPAMSLHEELRGLAERTLASDALVIDARSPIVWGAADEDRVSRPDDSQPTAEIVRLDDHRASGERFAPSEPPPRPAPELTEVPAAPLTRTDRAIAIVRALPVLISLHKGGHLHHAERGDDFGFVARSFAGIYVLIVVFDAPFDELRVERAVQHALPTIERLVMALPPLDPTPMAGAMAIRRGRGRRR